MIKWDLRNDALTLGQWLIGRIDDVSGPSGLSPDGELLVYAASKGGRGFTVLSRPPFFSALSFWDNRRSDGAGGFFTDNRTLVLGFHQDASSDTLEKPDDFRITDVWEYFWQGKRFARWDGVMAKSPDCNHGWTLAEVQIGSAPRIYEKPNARNALLVLERQRTDQGFKYRLIDRAAPIERILESAETNWVDWAPDGSLLLGDGGCLYRRRSTENRATLGIEQTAALIADLSDQRFESIAPTEEAFRWPEPVH
jgi:hypothetical protein